MGKRKKKKPKVPELGDGLKPPPERISSPFAAALGSMKDEMKAAEQAPPAEPKAPKPAPHQKNQLHQSASLI